ncbi:hypothetical protein BDK92_1896 [Micromonospora pisi]|uniref:YtxH-like protein n=1 Tax=Micromonospora pisi TaxID=589240 RepID=A0A495JFI5_9ACTN|nr:hypothetical protein [Micromonospora pisi]RKR87605.1 hypothetical protein BDK92_1896 [Micromonospora pisi]
MRGKLWFIGGLAAGFVLGARAGREKYEELVVRGRKVLDHPTVQEAAGVAQAQANRLYAEGKDRLSHTRLGEKLGQVTTANGNTTELTSTGAGSTTTPANRGTNPSGSGTGSASF